MPPRNNHKERSSPENQTQPPPSSKPNASISSYSSDADNFSSPPPMKPIVFPPGFKFVPTDEDLIFHYLKPYLEGNKNPFPNVQIHCVNIYESNPEQLSKEYEKGNDKEWFFITERTKKREGGKVVNRSDNGGSWKSVTAPKKIEARQGIVGYKTVLDYQIGRPPNNVKSDWIMHEYWFESNGHNKKVDHALCKIFLTPRVQKRKAEEEENEKKKKKGKMKEEIVDVDALEDEVDQPCNTAFQQHPQFCVPLLDPFQPHQSLIQQKQWHNYASQQQLHNVATVVDVDALEEEFGQHCNAAYRQLCEPPLDPCQRRQSLIQQQQLHNVEPVIDVQAVEEEIDQICNAAFQQPQFCVPPLDPFQPQQSLIQQLKNYAYQLLHNVANQPPQPQIFRVSQDSLQPQIFLVSQDWLQPQTQEQQQWPILNISDEFSEGIKFQQQPVIPDDDAHYQDRDEESSNSRSLEEIVKEGMTKD